MIEAFLVAALLQEVPFEVEVDGSKETPISPLIYGMNQPDWKRDRAWCTLGRSGGNRLTAYN